MPRFESIRSKLVGLTLTMFVAVLLAAGVGGFILYQTSISETAQRLTETAKSNARFFEAVASFDKRHYEENHSDAYQFDGTRTVPLRP